MMMEWLEFWGAIAPKMLDLGQKLYADFKGDPAKAIARIDEIRSHTAERAAAEANIDAQLDELAAATAEKKQAEPVDAQDAPEPELAHKSKKH